MMKFFESFVLIVVISGIIGFVFTLMFAFCNALAKIRNEKRLAKINRKVRLKKLLKISN